VKKTCSYPIARRNKTCRENVWVKRDCVCRMGHKGMEIGSRCGSVKDWNHVSRTDIGSGPMSTKGWNVSKYDNLFIERTFRGTLTERPPTESPSDILTHTERPLYIWLTVTFVPSDILAPSCNIQRFNVLPPFSMDVMWMSGVCVLT
jgi:hypothetical protein